MREESTLLVHIQKSPSVSLDKQGSRRGGGIRAISRIRYTARGTIRARECVSSRPLGVFENRRFRREDRIGFVKVAVASRATSSRALKGETSICHRRCDRNRSIALLCTRAELGRGTPTRERREREREQREDRPIYSRDIFIAHLSLDTRKLTRKFELRRSRTKWGLIAYFDDRAFRSRGHSPRERNGDTVKISQRERARKLSQLRIFARLRLEPGETDGGGGGSRLVSEIRDLSSSRLIATVTYPFSSALSSARESADVFKTPTYAYAQNLPDRIYHVRYHAAYAAPGHRRYGLSGRTETRMAGKGRGGGEVRLARYEISGTEIFFPRSHHERSASEVRARRERILSPSIIERSIRNYFYTVKEFSSERERCALPHLHGNIK